MKRNNQLIHTSVIVAVVLTMALIGGAVLYSSSIQSPQILGAESKQTEVESYGALHPFEAPFVKAADRIKPAVVTITTVRKVGPALAPTPPLSPFPFNDLFGRDFNRFFEQLPRGEYKQRGLGSGVIVNADGYILTNNHVIDGADELHVQLDDGRKIKAALVGTDPKSDLAVIRIDAKNLIAATLGQSNDIRVGQWVMAVGNPFGLSQTVTTGIISATSREGIGVAQYEDFIQTDAAINHGNSGGPLINLKGQVIGINTAIMSRSGGNNGVGMAIPIDMARNVMDQLIEKGSVTRGWLGVIIQDLSAKMAQTFGYAGKGVLIGDVLKDSPAAKGGLKVGDIIYSADGKSVTGVSEFRHQIARAAPGSSIRFGVFRDGKNQQVTVKLGSMFDDVAKAAPVRDLHATLGMELSDLTSAMRKQFRISDNTKGAVITKVVPNSVVAEAGLRIGDVLTGVQGEAITNAAEASKQLDKYKLKEGVRIQVQRGDSLHYVFLQANG